MKRFDVRLLVPLAAVLLISLLMMRASRLEREAAPDKPLPYPYIGRQLPELAVAGWIDGNGPTAAQLAGKVVVIDCWALGCGPCELAAPHLVELAKHFERQGVVFLGLAPHGDEYLAEMQEFLARQKTTWPNGYGAGFLMHELLMVKGYPTTLVVGRDGRIAFGQIGWTRGGGGDLDHAIADAVAKSGEAEKKPAAPEQPAP